MVNVPKLSSVSDTAGWRRPVNVAFLTTKRSQLGTVLSIGSAGHEEPAAIHSVWLRLAPTGSAMTTSVRALASAVSAAQALACCGQNRQAIMANYAFMHANVCLAAGLSQKAFVQKHASHDLSTIRKGNLHRHAHKHVENTAQHSRHFVTTGSEHTHMRCR